MFDAQNCRVIRYHVLSSLLIIRYRNFLSHTFDCTELHMFVGTAANSAYQNPGLAFDLGIRQNLVKHM